MSPANARTPLFDRLVDLTPTSRGSEPQPYRSLTRAELKESVRRELERLFNTRLSVPAHVYSIRELTVIDYGIPDFSTYSPKNTDDWRRLASVLRRTVAVFEPRLREVEVIVDDYNETNKSLRVRVDGVLVIDSVPQPVSFPSVIPNTGTSEVDAAP